MADFEWRESEEGGVRRLVCARPSGYTASIVVDGDRVAVELEKSGATKKTIDEPPRPVPSAEVEGTVTCWRREIEARLTELESGHS
jgi:hypothetical protein